MPRLPAHGDDEVPARRGPGIHHQVLHDVHADVTRGLEAEGVHRWGQVQVVVDGLGHMYHVDAPTGLLFHPHGRVGRIVSADGDEHGDVQAEQGNHHVLQMLGIPGGIGPGDAKEGPAPEVDAAHLVDVEDLDMADVPLHDPFEAVPDAQHLDAFEVGPDGGGTDDAIDPRRRPSADEDGKSLGVAHNWPPARV